METVTCMLRLQTRLYWELWPGRWWMVTASFHLMKWLLKLKRGKMIRGNWVLLSLDEVKVLQHYTKKNWTHYFLNFINLFHENLSHCQAAQQLLWENALLLRNGTNAFIVLRPHWCSTSTEMLKRCAMLWRSLCGAAKMVQSG